MTKMQQIANHTNHPMKEDLRGGESDSRTNRDRIIRSRELNEKCVRKAQQLQRLCTDPENAFIHIDGSTKCPVLCWMNRQLLNLKYDRMFLACSRALLRFEFE